MLRTTATSCDLEPLAWHQNVKLDPSAHARLNAEVSSRGSLGERNERENGSRPGRCAGHTQVARYVFGPPSISRNLFQAPANRSTTGHTTSAQYHTPGTRSGQGGWKKCLGLQPNMILRLHHWAPAQEPNRCWHKLLQGHLPSSRRASNS